MKCECKHDDGVACHRTPVLTVVYATLGGRRELGHVSDPVDGAAAGQPRVEEVRAPVQRRRTLGDEPDLGSVARDERLRRAARVG